MFYIKINNYLNKINQNSYYQSLIINYLTIFKFRDSYFIFYSLIINMRLPYKNIFLS